MAQKRSRYGFWTKSSVNCTRQKRCQTLLLNQFAAKARLSKISALQNRNRNRRRNHRMTESELSDLALDAARELDGRRRGARGTGRSEALAKALLQSFAREEKRPALPLESIGLVCNVLENYGGLEKPADYQALRQSAQDAATKL